MAQWLTVSPTQRLPQAQYLKANLILQRPGHYLLAAAHFPPFSMLAL